MLSLSLSVQQIDVGINGSTEPSYRNSPYPSLKLLCEGCSGVCLWHPGTAGTAGTADTAGTVLPNDDFLILPPECDPQPSRLCNRHLPGSDSSGTCQDHPRPTLT